MSRTELVEMGPRDGLQNEKLMVEHSIPAGRLYRGPEMLAERGVI